MDMGSDPTSTFWGLAIGVVHTALCLLCQFRRRVFVRRLIRAMSRPGPWR